MIVSSRCVFIALDRVNRAFAPEAASYEYAINPEPLATLGRKLRAALSGCMIPLPATAAPGAAYPAAGVMMGMFLPNSVKTR